MGNVATTLNIIRKPAPHRANTRDVSVAAMSTPPIAGIIILELCQMMELSATALIMSDLSIKVGKMACLVGQSKPEIKDTMPATVMMCQGSTRSDASSHAKNSIKDATSDEVVISNFLRFTRSARAPPNKVMTMAGMEAAAPR